MYSYHLKKKKNSGKRSSQLPIFAYIALIVTKLGNYRAVHCTCIYPEGEQKAQFGNSWINIDYVVCW